MKGKSLLDLRKGLMLEYIKYNFKLMLKQKTFQFSFLLLLFMGIVHPLYYVILFWGKYNYALPSADTLYIGNNGGTLWQYIALLFPFIIILPYSLSFYKENKIGTLFYVQIRGTRKEYYFSQAIVCFVGTMIVFFIPLLLNILLNSMLFPINGNDYISSYDYSDYNWSSSIMSKGYPFKGMAIVHPQLYNLLFAFILAFVSGIMAVFIYAVSVLLQKGAIYLMLANYLLFTTFSIIDKIIERASPLYINTNLASYLSVGYFNSGLVYPLYVLFLLFEIIASYFIIRIRIRKDEL